MSQFTYDDEEELDDTIPFDEPDDCEEDFDIFDGVEGWDDEDY